MADSRQPAASDRGSSRGWDVRVLSSFEATGLDGPAWNGLAAHGTNSVFQTYEWHRSWWHAYGGRHQPLLITAADTRGTRGIAPLYVERTGTGTRVARFVGDGRADYCDLLAGGDPATVAALAGGLCDHDGWDVADLSGIPAESRTVEALRSLCEGAGCRVIVRDQSVCPTLMIHGHERAAQSILDKPSLRRRQNYFERAGRLRFRDLTSAAEIAPYLDAFFAQHAARWSHTRTPSLFQDEANRTFYRELVSRFDRTGWLVFSLVEFDDRPIAFHYGFDYNDTLIWYKPSFDPAFASRSPGLVLVRHLIRRALEDGRRELDFTIGDEPFKRRFTNVVRKTVNVQIFRSQTLYLLTRSRLHMMDAVRRALTKVRSSQ